MRFFDWSSFDWDTWTIGWALWALFFVLWESASGIWGNGEMLTDHLRPIFLSSPVVWFIAFGVWLWLGFHLLAPALESWLILAAGGAE